MTPGVLDKIEKHFSAFGKKHNIPGLSAVFTIKNETRLCTAGNLSIDNKEPVNPDTLFEIGSISKPLTAALIRSMDQKGLIESDKSIYHYLNGKYDVSPVFKHILIKDVLVHRAGLPGIPTAFLLKMKNSVDPYADIGSDDFKRFLKSPEGLNKPGRFMYSNFGYAILAEIICVISKSTFDEAACRFLFDPLNMHRTGTLQKFTEDTNIAVGHARKNMKVPYWTGHLLNGAGSFLSTSRDLQLFLQFAITIPDPQIWGWQVKNGFFSRILGYRGFIWHNGMTGGFGSYMAFHPVKNASMILLANKAVIPDSFFYYFSSHVR